MLKDSQAAEEDLIARGPDLSGASPDDLQAEVAKRRGELALLQREVMACVMWRQLRCCWLSQGAILRIPLSGARLQTSIPEAYSALQQISE